MSDTHNNIEKFEGKRICTESILCYSWKREKRSSCI